MTPEQEHRLPVYAQEELHRLRDRAVSLEARMDDLLGTGKPRPEAPQAIHHSYPKEGLPDEVPIKADHIRWNLNEHTYLEAFLEADLKSGTYRLQVRSSGSHTGSLVVRPRVSNVVTIGVEPW